MTKLWQQLEPTHKLNLLLPALKYKLRTSVCFHLKGLASIVLWLSNGFFDKTGNRKMVPLNISNGSWFCSRWKPDFCDKSVAAGPILFIKVFCWMKLVAWFHYVPLGTYPAWLKPYSAPFLAMFLLVPPLFVRLFDPNTNHLTASRSSASPGHLPPAATSLATTSSQCNQIAFHPTALVIHIFVAKYEMY